MYECMHKICSICTHKGEIHGTPNSHPRLPPHKSMATGLDNSTDLPYHCNLFWTSFSSPLASEQWECYSCCIEILKISYQLIREYSVRQTTMKGMSTRNMPEYARRKIGTPLNQPQTNHWFLRWLVRNHPGLACKKVLHGFTCWGFGPVV